MNWRKCKYVRIMKLQRNINGKSNLEGQYWAEEKLQGQKGQLTYTRTDICVISLPVFDALSFHNTFEDAKANESLCAFQNMYLEINKKTQQMSKLYGVITDTVKYKDNILKQGPIKFYDTV